MIVPEFLRFYSGYTLAQTLGEYAVSFFSLVNSMYRLQARETSNAILSVGTAMSGNREALDALKKQEGGIHKIVQEVKLVKEVKNVRR